MISIQTKLESSDKSTIDKKPSTYYIMPTHLIQSYYNYQDVNQDPQLRIDVINFFYNKLLKWVSSSSIYTKYRSYEDYIYNKTSRIKNSSLYKNNLYIGIFISYKSDFIFIFFPFFNIIISNLLYFIILFSFIKNFNGINDEYFFIELVKSYILVSYIILNSNIIGVICICLVLVILYILFVLYII